MSLITISTTATPEGALGGTINDVAHISFDTTQLPFAPTGLMGTVTFEAFFVDDPDCTGEAMFSSGPHDVVLDAGRSDVVVESDPFFPTMRGEYRWRVDYRQGSRPEAAPFASFRTECGGPGEVSVVRMLLPHIAIRATVASRLGQFIRARAVVTGQGAQPPPTGSVRFELLGPDDPECTDAPIFTSDTHVLEGMPPSATSNIFRPTRPGTYRWRVQYGGDEEYVSLGTHCRQTGATSVVSEHRAEETMTAAEQGSPPGHSVDALSRNQVIYAEIVDLLPLPGEVPE